MNAYSAIKADHQNYIAALTGLRGLAALFVFWRHFMRLYEGPEAEFFNILPGVSIESIFYFGFVGVDIFFVLSGFLLALPFARYALDMGPRVALGRYFVRRVLRVFPAYYLQLIIILLVGDWFLTWREMTDRSLIAHLFMFFNIGSQPIRPMVGVWWTLPVEFAFYLVLPFLALFLKPRKWIFALATGLLISMVYRVWSADNFTHLSEHGIVLIAQQLPGRGPTFLLGVTAAVLAVVFQKKGWSKPGPRWLDAMVVVGAAALWAWVLNIVPVAGGNYWKGHWMMVMAPTVMGTAIAIGILAIYWGSPLGRLLFANRLVYFFGVISYSLYLWHFPVTQQIYKLLGTELQQLSFSMQWLLMTGATVLVSWLSYLLAERPFIRLKSRIGKPVSPTKKASESA